MICLYSYIPYTSTKYQKQDKKKKKKNGEEPPDTGGGQVFSLDATLGLLATRRRLGRWGDSSAMRSAFVA